jgi:hypothetical protein
VLLSRPLLAATALPLEYPALEARPKSAWAIRVMRDWIEFNHPELLSVPGATVVEGYRYDESKRWKTLTLFLPNSGRSSTRDEAVSFRFTRGWRRFDSFATSTRIGDVIIPTAEKCRGILAIRRFTRPSPVEAGIEHGAYAIALVDAQGKVTQVGMVESERVDSFHLAAWLGKNLTNLEFRQSTTDTRFPRLLPVVIRAMVTRDAGTVSVYLSEGCRAESVRWREGIVDGVPGDWSVMQVSADGSGRASLKD